MFLNTHPKYKEFRIKRFNLQKQKNMTPDKLSYELSNYLQAYSTNPEYGKRLREVMKTIRQNYKLTN
jgi:uncharacterized FlgJ-related protein